MENEPKNQPNLHEFRGAGTNRSRLQAALKASIEEHRQLQEKKVIAGPAPPVEKKKKRQHNGAPKSAPAPKRGANEEKEGKKESSTEVPLEEKRWLAVQYLLFAFSQIKTAPRNALTFLEKCKADVKELDCHELVVQPFTKGLENLASIFPDFHDYRHQNHYFKSTTTPPGMKKKGWKHPLPLPPQIKLTGQLGFDITTTDGDEIVKLAKEWIGTGINKIFNHKYSPALPNAKENKTVEEYQQKFPSNEIPRRALQLPVHVLEVKKGFNPEEVSNFVKSSPVSVIRGLTDAVDINLEVFTPKTLRDAVLKAIKEKTIETKMIEAIRQRVQKSTSNHSFRAKGNEGCEWHLADVRHEVPFLDFVNNFLNLQKIATKAFKSLRTTDDHNGVVDSLVKKIEDSQLPLAAELSAQANPGTIFTTFGSNFDLDNKKVFKDQFVALEKLPEVFQFNATDSLCPYFREKLEGVNGFQIYFKGPGARTGAHVENQLLCSININIGPGYCVWICVLFEYSEKMENLLRKKGLQSYAQYWPDEDELLKAGIPIIKYLQKPGDTVTIGVGTYHWVQSNGFTVNVAWNTGRLDYTQMASTMISHDHNAVHNHTTLLPIVPMAWNIIRSKVAMEDKLKALFRSVAARSLGYVVFEKDFADKLVNETDSRFKMGDIQDIKVESVERCVVVSCHRVLFNTIIRYDKEESSYCFKCALSTLKERMTGMMTIYHRETTENLVQDYNAAFPVAQSPAQDH